MTLTPADRQNTHATRCARAESVFSGPRKTKFGYFSRGSVAVWTACHLRREHTAPATGRINEALMTGVITSVHLLKHGVAIIREFGLRCYVRCVYAVVTRRRTTFLHLLGEGRPPR